MSLPWPARTGSPFEGEPLYVGILNVTPDSFSDGGRYLDPEAAVAQARTLLDQGVGVLDVGGESTRPAALPVSEAEEWARLAPVLARLRAELPGVPLSLDTRHPGVAARGLQAGVAILNDVTGFSDPELLGLARDSGCGLIATRSRVADGAFLMPPYAPEDPADPPGPPGANEAADAVAELAAVRDRLLGAGIDPGRVLLDPGFGFGLTFREDLALWEALPALPATLDWPAAGFCLAVSRKRMLAWGAGSPQLPAAQRDLLTARAHREALKLGYRVFRTHTGMRPRVRPARAEEAEGLAQVQISSWRSAYRDIIPAAILDRQETAPLVSAFQAMAGTPPPRRLWAMAWAGKLCGYAATGPCREPEPGLASTGELMAIYSLKESWGLGLGQALMASALAGLREDGFGRAVLWVLERNPRARHFYEAGGWALTGASRTVWHDGIALRELQYALSLAGPG